MRWPWVSAARLEDAHREMDLRALRIQSLEAQLDSLRQGQLTLVDQLLRPHHQGVVPVTQAIKLDEETGALAKIRDETIAKMADEFVAEMGMSTRDAWAEARRLATQAEALYG